MSTPITKVVTFNGAVKSAKDFWKRVTKTEKCWMWNGRTDSYGRGLVWWEGKQITAHRLAWLLTKKTSLISVRHTCGVNGCVNPAHLVDGKTTDNRGIQDVWARTQKGPSGCIVWTAGKIPDGYGSFRFRGKQWLVHRLVWTLVNGVIPEDKRVLHKCDNPPCCNPEHLFLGTDMDNSKDRQAKGRGDYPKGEKHHRATLTEDIIRAIRKEYTGAYGQLSSIGRKYGIAPSNVQAIVRRKIWQHVD